MNFLDNFMLMYQEKEWMYDQIELDCVIQAASFAPRQLVQSWWR